jgi:hypothetical protein
MITALPQEITDSGTLENTIGLDGTAPFAALLSKPLFANSCAWS